MDDQQKRSGKKIFIALGLLTLVVVGIIVCVLIWPKSATLEEAEKNAENTTQPLEPDITGDMILTVTTGVTRTRPEPVTKVYDNLPLHPEVYLKGVEHAGIHATTTYYKRIKVVKVLDDRIWLKIENEGASTAITFQLENGEVIRGYPKDQPTIKHKEKTIVIRCGTEQSLSFDFIDPDLTFTFKLEKKETARIDGKSETKEPEPTTSVEPTGKMRLTVTEDRWSGWGIKSIGRMEKDTDGEDVMVFTPVEPSKPKVTVFDDVRAGIVVRTSYDGDIKITKVEEDNIYISFDNKSFLVSGEGYSLSFDNTSSLASDEDSAEHLTEIVLECGEAIELYTPTLDAGTIIYFELERE